MLDYDHIADEIARKNKANMNGYDIRLFETYEVESIGYPFFRIIDFTTSAELKIVLVGGPLYKD